jgi:hypothetical protein
MCYAGVEIVNSARAAQYASQFGINVQSRGCVDLAASLGDLPYTDPATDPAPWFDPGVPESVGFCGFVGLDFVGAEAGTGTSRWTSLIGDGGVSGPLRRDAREMTVKTVAVGADEAALSYGIAWLASVLRGAACQVGDELLLYAACPSPTRLPCTSTDPEPPFDPVARGDQLARRLFNVMLLQGPAVQVKKNLAASRRSVSSVGGQQGFAGGLTSEVNYTVKAGIPFFYHEPGPPVASATGGVGDPGTIFYADLVPNYDPDAWVAVCAAQRPAQPCLPDSPLPGCVDKLPPVLPPPPADPCYPSGPYGTARRLIYQIPAQAKPAWMEKVPVIELATGSAPLARVVIRWYMNPIGDPPGPTIDPCGICAQFTVAGLSSHTTLTVDGRTNRAAVDCGGGLVDSPILYGPQGELFDWPVFDCNSSMFLEVLTDYQFPWAPDATLRVYLVARGDTC